MPALQQIVYPASNTLTSACDFKILRSQSNLSSFAPKGVVAEGGAGKLDVQKFFDFFSDSSLTKEVIEHARKSRFGLCDKLVIDTFQAYCERLSSRKIFYNPNDHLSPFSDGFNGASNCRGRAKGFLQIMGILGVGFDKLKYCQIGAEDRTKKLCQKSKADIPSSVRVVVAGNAFAPNAVKIVVQGGKATVLRTEREPFANHYAAYIDSPLLSYKYWDPLEGTAYINGFDDYFLSYSLDNGLTSSAQNLLMDGVQCFVNPDNMKERLYYLPEAAKWRARILRSGMGSKGLVGSEAFFNQPAFKAVDGTLREMNDGVGSSVALIIDKSDWTETGSAHPGVIAVLAAR